LFFFFFWWVIRQNNAIVLCIMVPTTGTRSRVDCFGNEQSAASRRVCFCPSRNANLAARKWGAKRHRARTIPGRGWPARVVLYETRNIYRAGWRAPQLENINGEYYISIIIIIIVRPGGDGTHRRAGFVQVIITRNIQTD